MKSVFCIATSRRQSDYIIDCLKYNNFSSRNISVLFSGEDSWPEFVHERQTKTQEGKRESEASVGKGSLGWLAGIRVFAIPETGFMIASGPLAIMMNELAVGGAVGGITGGLTGLGIPELEAKRYEENLANGNILISVCSDNSREVADAEEIFSKACAEELYTVEEVANC